MKVFLFAFLFTFLFAETSLAARNENYAGLGLNLDTYSENLPDRFELEQKFKLAPVIGWKTTLLWDNVGFRSGVFGEYKNILIDDDLAVNGKDDISLTAYYLSVPLNLLFQATDRFSVFGGLTPRLLVLKSCEDCEKFDGSPAILTNTYNIGAAFELNTDVSFEVNFQQGIDESFNDVKINTAQALVYWNI